jgi:hypothetical protein
VELFLLIAGSVLVAVLTIANCLRLLLRRRDAADDAGT